MYLRLHKKTKVNVEQLGPFRFATLHKRKGGKEWHEGICIAADTQDDSSFQLVEIVFTPEEVERFVEKFVKLIPRFADPDRIPEVGDELVDDTEAD